MGELLLKKVILKNDSIREKLIMTYLPGMPIKPNFNWLPECKNPDQIECFLSWRSLAEGYIPESWPIGDTISCVNPISWKTDTFRSIQEEHLGILFKNSKIYYPSSIVAYNHKGVVWIETPKIPFAKFYRMKNYHIADYNLYWINIRENLKFRLKENGYN